MCQRLLATAPQDLSLLNMLGVIAAKSGQFGIAAGHFRDAMAIAPQDPGVISNLAQALLESGGRDEALECFRRVGDVESDTRLFQIADIDPAETAARQPGIHRLRNVTIDTGYWAVIDGDRIYCRETGNLNMANSPLIRGRITADRRYAVMSVPAIAMRVDTPCVFLGGDDNYAHWFYRYLTRLALLDDLPELGALPLLIGGDLKPYQRETLALLGYGEDRVVSVPRHTAIHCSDIHVPLCLWTDNEPITRGIHWLRNQSLATFDSPATPHGRRLFISRRDAPSRYLENEEAVMSALEPFGIERVELSKFSFVEQASMFSETELVVAPHGAGLANLIFAPETCRVVELVSDPIAHMSDFRIIQNVIGQTGAVVPCKSYTIDPGATKPMVQHNFRTDPTAVATAVAKLLG